MVDEAVCSSGVVVDPSAYRRPRLFHSVWTRIRRILHSVRIWQLANSAIRVPSSLFLSSFLFLSWCNRTYDRYIRSLLCKYIYLFSYRVYRASSLLLIEGFCAGRHGDRMPGRELVHQGATFDREVFLFSPSFSSLLLILILVRGYKLYINNKLFTRLVYLKFLEGS